MIWNDPKVFAKYIVFNIFWFQSTMYSTLTSTHVGVRSTWSKEVFLMAIVEARLRDLRTIAPWAEEHTKLVDNKLKTQDWKTI